MDHRLSDQLILIMLLERFYRLYCGRSSLSLICLGQYPGMENFVGLGQLTAEQLASLADTRSPVSEAEFALASAAWNAFTSSVPTDIELFHSPGHVRAPVSRTCLTSSSGAIPFCRKWPIAYRTAGALRSSRPRSATCAATLLRCSKNGASSLHGRLVLLRDSQRIGIGKVPSRSAGEQCLELRLR